MTIISSWKSNCATKKQVGGAHVNTLVERSVAIQLVTLMREREKADVKNIVRSMVDNPLREMG